MIPTSSAVSDYEDQIAAFFQRAKNKAEGEAELTKHAGMLLAALPDLLPTLKECPAYAGVAFYGRFQAVNGKLIERLAADGVTSKVALDSIRTAKALRVAASAKAGWDFLLGADTDALWSAILLNLRRKTRVVAEAAAAADDESDDEDGHDESENGDEDDDN
jgi:hypothetical protein